MVGEYALWVSIPCTGAYHWQIVHATMGPDTEAVICRHCTKLRQLWRVVEGLAADATADRQPVHIEWPRNCACWKDARVKKFVARFSGTATRLDGCQCRMVSQEAKSKGQPIMKPWTVMAFNSVPTEALQLRCPQGA